MSRNKIHFGFNANIAFGEKAVLAPVKKVKPKNLKEINGRVTVKLEPHKNTL